jgi:hypothetical protein
VSKQVSKVLLEEKMSKFFLNIDLSLANVCEVISQFVVICVLLSLFT